MTTSVKPRKPLYARTRVRAYARTRVRAYARTRDRDREYLGSTNHFELHSFEKRTAEDHLDGDFHMFQLVPRDGVLVLGFAKAFTVKGSDVAIIAHISKAE